MSDSEQPTINPASDASTAPAEEMAVQVSWEEEARIIKELTEKAPQIVEGNHYYVVSTRWFKSWKMYTNYDWDYRSNNMNIERPDQIDNSSLVDEEDENYIKKSVLENIDFIVVPEEAWDKLYAWYGGGPVLRRKAIKVGYYKEVVVEIRPLRLKIVSSDDLTKELICYCSKTTTIKEFSDFLCERLELDPKKIRIFDYHANTKIKQLDEMDKSMEDSQIIDNQKVLIEIQKEDGTWPDVPSRSSTNNYGSYSSYSSYGGGYSSSSSYSYGRREQTTPGLCGLMNLGNTCFMNSALQCLSNSTPLTKFFVSEKYKRDLNRTNPLGMQGELADEYAKLLGEIWSGTYSAAEPRGFKFKIERFAPQFAGYNQHDSQELLAFLLDGLHEDLNRVTVKPYVEAKESEGRPDQEVANEAWQGHKSRNDSIIVDWFQGQLKSTLVCPDCGRVSVTFDPFMYLSLPMPHKTTRDIKVTMHFLDPQKKLTRYLVSVEKFGSIPDLKQAVGKLCGLNPESIVLCDVFNNKFYRQMKDNDNVEDVGDNDVIHGYEITVPKTEEEKDNTIHVPVYWRRDDRSMKTMFGAPFIMSLPSKITYRELYKIVAEQYIARFLKKPIPTEFAKPEPEPEVVEANTEAADTEQRDAVDESNEVERMDVDENKTQAEAADDDNKEASSSDDSTDSDSSDDELMSYALKRARANTASSDNSSDDERNNKYNQRRNAPPAEILPGAAFTIVGIDSWGQDTLRFDDPDAPLDLKDRQILALHFSEESFMEYYGYSAERDIVLDESVTNPLKDETRREMSLYDCLELFTKEETLSKNDPWYCSKCKDHKQATKKFDLWKVPPIIVIHLKRFSYRNRVWREKLETFVDFPLDDLDLSQYALGAHDQPAKYELFAVSNHMGTMGMGHYTAYGKNYKTNKWYLFDDSRVSPASESEVKSNTAYLLFYRRKDVADFADETATTTATTDDVATAEAENKSDSDSENDSDDAEKDSDSNDDHLLADIGAPRADFDSLQAGGGSDGDD